MKGRTQKRVGKPGINKRALGDGYTAVLARAGYYSAPVQKLVRKWTAKGMPERLIEDYFPSLAATLSRSSMEINLALPNRGGFRRAFWELLIALEELHSNTGSPAYWLLSLPEISVRRTPIDVAHDATKTGINRDLPSWNEIREVIKKRGGPCFTNAALRQSATRLRLASVTASH
jgi:hypothetical protein